MFILKQVIQNSWQAFKNRKNVFAKITVFLVLSFFVGEKAFYTIDPYPTGDAFEYIMMTEALYNHATPDIRLQDVQSFKQDYTKVLDWERNMKYRNFDEAETLLSDTSFYHYMYEISGCFVDLKGQIYSYHFFFYSLLNVPARWVMDIAHESPLKCFQIMNALMILFTSAVLLWYKPMETFKACLLAISFVFSAAFWYIGWVHTEVYSICLVTLSLWLAFRNHYYLPILLASVAALQNQALIALVLLLAAKALFEQKITFGNLMKIAVSCIWVLWPSVFYYYHFHISNLVNYRGFLSNEYITPTRFVGFFIDLNQGALLAIPIALFLFVFLWIRIIYLNIRSKRKPEWIDLLPIVIAVITIGVCTMGNWNHGQAVINRYATWVSAMMLIMTFIWLYKSGFSNLTQYTIMICIAVSQYEAILYFEKDNKYDWMSGILKPQAKWVIENYPQFYNPDPTILIGRKFGGGELSAAKELIIFNDKAGNIRKIMVHRERMDLLGEIGVSKSSIEKYKTTLNFINGWAHINNPHQFLSKEMTFKINHTMREKDIEIMIAQIKANPPLFKEIEIRAEKYNVTVDSMLKVNAIYLLDR